MLTCDPDDDHPNYKTHPCIIIEVLSPSTANTDRREKWHAYRSIENLNAYLMVDADQRRVDYCIRDEQRQWVRGCLEADEVLTLNCGQLKVPLCLDDLYEDVAV